MIRVVVWRRLVCGLFVGMIAFLLFLALLWQFWFIPRMALYRPAIVAHLTQVSGQPITIEHIHGGWDGIKPTLSFENVRLLDASHQPILRFSKLEGALAWWRLAIGQLRFSHIAFYDPRVNLLRCRDGRWQIEGMVSNDNSTGGQRRLGDWLLSQGSLSIVNATLSLRDEQLGAPPIKIYAIDYKSNHIFGHQHFAFKSLLSGQGVSSGLEGDGQWVGQSIDQIHEWSGLVHLRLKRIDLALFSSWVQPILSEKPDLGPNTRGNGNISLIIDFKDKKIQKLNADLDLSTIDFSLAGRRWVFPILNANISWKTDPNTKTFEMNARQVSGIAGDLFRQGYVQYRETSEAGGQVLLRGLQLNNLMEYIDVLPEPFAMPLKDGKLFGLLESLRYTWTGAFKRPKTYTGDFGLEAVTVQFPKILPQWGPFDIQGHIETQSGHLQLTGNRLQFNLPAQFVDPLYFETMQLKTHWLRTENTWRFNIDKVALSNPDMALEVDGQYTWSGKDWGQLKLNGQINRLSAKKAYAYLPRAIGDDTLVWLRHALRDGEALDGQIVVDGPLAHFPFQGGKEGLFRITAKAQNVTLDYANNWPILHQVEGDMKFEGRSMHIRNASAQLTRVQLNNIDAQIADMGNHPVLELSGQGVGESTHFLQFVNSSPVRRFTSGFLDSLKTQGNAQIDLKLKIPIDNTDRSTVAGQYRFDKNRLDFGHSIPIFDQASGQIAFTEHSIQLDEASARTLGGKVQFLGKNNGAGQLTINLKGSVRAAQVNQYYAIPFSSVLSGSIDVQGQLNIGKDNYDLSLQSNLMKAGVDLPFPLKKRAGHPLPSRLKISGKPHQTGVEFGYGPLLQGKLIWKAGLRPVGSISLGNQPPPESEQTIIIRGGWPQIDLTSWSRFLDQMNRKSFNGSTLVSDANLSFAKMKIMNRLLHDVKVNASIGPDSHWKVGLSSKEVAGKLDCDHQRWVARLNYLHFPLPIEETDKVEPEYKENSLQWSNLPELDLEIDDLRYEEKKLGKLVVKGTQKKDFWQVNSIELRNPDVHFSFSGKWNNRTKPDHTQGHFMLESRSFGRVLNLFGYRDAVQNAPGKLSGEISWDNTPFEPMLSSLQGRIKLDVKEGQFLKLDPGVGRFLSILSLQALSRRLKLDFNDLFSRGLDFSHISGDATIRRGTMYTDNLSVNASSARIRFVGDVNFVAGTQKLSVRVVPTLSEGVAIATGVLNPIAGLAALVLQKVFKDPLGQLIAYEYEVTGSTLDPEIKRVSSNFTEHLIKTK